MRTILSVLRVRVLPVGVVLLTACATGPQIRHDMNPTANFAGYKTFGYFSPLATDRAAYTSLFSAHLKDAARRSMESKGYVYTETNPDLLINFFANVQDRQEVRVTPAPAGYYGYRRGLYSGFGWSSVETVSYREGTLTVDVVEAGRKILIWQAIAEGTVSNEARKNPGPAIDALVTKMMETLPAAGGT